MELLLEASFLDLKVLELKFLHSLPGQLHLLRHCQLYSMGCLFSNFYSCSSILDEPLPSIFKLFLDMLFLPNFRQLIHYTTISKPVNPLLFRTLQGGCLHILFCCLICNICVSNPLKALIQPQPFYVLSGFSLFNFHCP